MRRTECKFSGDELVSGFGKDFARTSLFTGRFLNCNAPRCCSVYLWLVAVSGVNESRYDFW